MQINEQHILLLIIIIFVLYLIYVKKTNIQPFYGKNSENRWNLLGGTPQIWEPKLVEKNICDTDYNDSTCKFTTTNCVTPFSMNNGTV